VLMLRPPLRSSLFPYTTLFRSIVFVVILVSIYITLFRCDHTNLFAFIKSFRPCSRRGTDYFCLRHKARDDWLNGDARFFSIWVARAIGFHLGECDAAARRASLR